MSWIRNATQAIKRALAGDTRNRAAPACNTVPGDARDKVASAPMPQQSPTATGASGPIESVPLPPVDIGQSATQVLDAKTNPPVTVAAVSAEISPIHCEADAQSAPPPVPVQAETTAAVETGADEFIAGVHTFLLQTRHYRLYVPPGHAGRRLPLVVMLHGCNQDPEDFAIGTGMNEQAREQVFYVLYPEQSQFANASRCWNWFMREHQQRNRGEPGLLASMTQAVIEEHDIDTRQVFIAGLSAGGAMAAIIAATYPEMFSAVGVHSGLPRGAASNIFEALSAMKSGSPGVHAKPRTAAAAAYARAVPTIVFHGDLDHTVHPRNGEQVIEATLCGTTEAGVAEIAANSETSAQPADNPLVEYGESACGQRYTRSTHRDAQRNLLAEYWQLHGAGHAWSGGNAKGSYTDSGGADATREMLKFFFAHRAAPARAAMQIAAE